MTVNVRDVASIMDQWAPLDTAASWDRVGLQLGRLDQPVERVLIALDVNEHVLKALEQVRYDCIVTHHPLFFKPIYQLNTAHGVGKVVQLLMEKNVTIWTAHTNLDIAEDGVNDALIEAYGFDPRDAECILDYIKVLPNPQKLTMGDLAKVLPVHHPIESDYIPSRIGFCAGSAKSFVPQIFGAGFDALITGELGYHEELDCQLESFAYLMVGHAESERYILSKIRDRILATYSRIHVDIIG